MDTVSNWDHKALMSELSQGIELTKQLRFHLSSASSYETQEMLLWRILSSFENAMLILNKAGSASRQLQPVGPAAGFPESSSRSTDFNKGFKDQQEQTDVSKKRNVLPTGTNQPNDDGYSWRNYGIKEILGAKYPRDYYRCRYRIDQYCKARKQTQRPDDDDDPTVLNITYIGSHTCGQVSHSVLPSASPEKQEPKKNNNHQQQQQQQHQTNETLFNFRANLRINTEELNYKTFLMFVVLLFVLCASLLVWC